MSKFSWQQGAVVYQIYPRSFADSSGNGVGDLRGIINKLDYLGGTHKSLNVSAIWLSPIYTSPMADFGYDVASYTDVDPLFGTLDDLKELVSEAHARGIKVLLDFVPNHTSNQHPWFLESCSSLTNPKRDWYVWSSPKDSGGVPNNWQAMFGGSAWEFDTATKQYYLHSFLAEQPDLNWENPEVRSAMKNAMRFWLDIGVDGFRVDAVDWLSKDPEMRDDPSEPEPKTSEKNRKYSLLKHAFSRDGPHLYDRLNEMAEVLGEYSDRFMITEGHPETKNIIDGYGKFYQGVNPSLSAPFNFQGIYLPWNAATFRGFVDAFQESMKANYLPIYTLGNHDEPRLASRVGVKAARTAAMMLLTLPGMAFVYYGDELGMENTPILPSQIQDPFALPGKGRDPQRTPMLWDGSAHAGFSLSKPWLPVTPEYLTLNAVTQTESSTSSLSLYKKLISLRQESAALKHGSYKSYTASEHVFCYQRSGDDQTFIVLLNFSGNAQYVAAPWVEGKIILSTFLDQSHQRVSEHIILRPHEGIIIQRDTSN